MRAEDETPVVGHLDLDAAAAPPDGRDDSHKLRSVLRSAPQCADFDSLSCH
jgi:hypothetical protein